MNILTNICNPKEDHFEQETRTETYKPLNDYIFQNRSMQKMRARNERVNNVDQFKYQSWNHPYSISNYVMEQKTPNLNTHQHSTVGSQQFMNYPNQLAFRKDGSKKISFKEIPQAINEVGKGQQYTQNNFSDINNFYTSPKANKYTYPNSHDRSNFNYHQTAMKNENYHQNSRENLFSNLFYSRENEFQNKNTTPTQGYTSPALSKQVLQLKQENKELKRIIDEQYKPMKELYNKLLAQQEEREYLISKLEWKVKELVKDIGGNSGLYPLGQPSTSQRNREQELNKEKVGIVKAESQKSLIYHHSNQANNFDQQHFSPKMEQSSMSYFVNHPTYPTQNKTMMVPINNRFQPQQVTSTNLPFSINSQTGYQQNNLVTGLQYPPNQFNPYQSRAAYLFQNNNQSNVNPNYNIYQQNQLQNNQNNGVLKNNLQSQFQNKHPIQSSILENQKGFNNQVNITNKQTFY